MKENTEHVDYKIYRKDIKGGGRQTGKHQGIEILL